MKTWKVVLIAAGCALISASVVAWAAQTNYLGTVFIADSTTPTQQLKVNSDGSINVDSSGGGGGAVTLPTTPTIAAGSGVVPAPSSEALAGLSMATCSVLCASQVVKASAGNLYAWNVSADSTLSAAPWWIMIFNATSLPADGTVAPAKCFAEAAGVTSDSKAWNIAPVQFGTGIVIGVSTTGCYTKTASTHAFISGDYK
jgi:hypothetical protein